MLRRARFVRPPHGGGPQNALTTADLAGIGYQNGWLATCRDSGCVVETANHG